MPSIYREARDRGAHLHPSAGEAETVSLAKQINFRFGETLSQKVRTETEEDTQ